MWVVCGASQRRFWCPEQRYVRHSFLPSKWRYLMSLRLPRYVEGLSVEEGDNLAFQVGA